MPVSQAVAIPATAQHQPQQHVIFLGWFVNYHPNVYKTLNEIIIFITFYDHFNFNQDSFK